MAKFESKYDIDDKLFYIEDGYTTEICSHCGSAYKKHNWFIEEVTIIDFRPKVRPDKTVVFSYKIDGYDSDIWIREDQLKEKSYYSDLAEAQAECDKRNDKNDS